MATLSRVLQSFDLRLGAVPRAHIYLALYLFALILLLSVGFGSHFRHVPGEMEMDEQEYHIIASQFLRGDFAISPRRTIGFPLLIAAIRLISENFLFLQIVVTAIYALSAPLLFRLLKKLGADDMPALLSGLAFAAWPTGLYYGTSLYSETVALPVFFCALSMLPLPFPQQLSNRRAVLSALAAGAVLGVAAHIRPMYLLFVPFAVLILLIENGIRRITWLKILGLLAGFAILVLPWSAMMYIRFNQTIILSSNAGENLAGGLTPVLFEPSAHGAVNVGSHVTFTGFGKWVTIDQNGYLSKAELQLPYEKQDKLLRDRAIAWVQSNPLQAAELELYKLTYMWGIYPITTSDAVQVVFGNIPMVVILAASLFFFVRLPVYRRKYARLWMLALFVSGVGLISWGSWRYRQCADAGLLAYCIACGWHMLCGIGSAAQHSLRSAETVAPRTNQGAV